MKPKDYEQRGELEALHEYDAWRAMRETDEPLLVGDLLETESGDLRICKYVGFEPAQWVVPEPKPHIPAPAGDAEPAEQPAAN